MKSSGNPEFGDKVWKTKCGNPEFGDKMAKSSGDPELEEKMAKRPQSRLKSFEIVRNPLKLFEIV